jgi:limonene-1,2-epoxide hydrolase
MKKWLLLLFIPVVSCSDTSQKTAVTDNASNKGKDNVAIVEQMYAAFNEHDWKKMAGFYTNPVTFLDPAYGNSHVQKTHDDMLKHYSGLQQWSPDVWDSITFIAPIDDNRVLIQFTSTGTTADKKEKWSLPLCTVLTLENGKIVKDEVYYDKD